MTCVSSPVCKIISLNPSGKSLLQLRPSRPKEGRWPSSRTLGGMRWTRRRRRRATPMRTAKSCGPDAPTLASSFVEAMSARRADTPRSTKRRWQKSPVTGESVKETVKTIAQGRPGVTGEPVVTTLVCLFHLHARLRVHRAPGFPCALRFREGQMSCQPRTHRAARMRTCICRFRG